MKRLALTLLLLLTTVACNRDQASRALATPQERPPIGDVARGKALVAQYGCNVCHVIPGIGGPQGSLGPSLQGLAARPVISFGTVQNTPENLARYIQNPASLNPQSGMPPVGLTDVDARDIAAYLLTLQ